MGIGAAYAGIVWLLSNEGMKSKTGQNMANANLDYLKRVARIESVMSSAL